MPVPKREEDTLKIFPYTPFLHPQTPPLEDICESPLVCVSVNATWASWIIGALNTLDQPDVWLGTDEEKSEAIQKVRSIISMFSNPCADDGNEYRTIINSWRQYQVSLEGLYDGTNPESVDEDAPDTEFNSDSADDGLEAIYRDIALCNACRVLVDVFCAEQLAQAGYYQQALNLLAGLLAAASGGTGGIIGLIIVVAVGVLVDISLDALEDETARANVACCLYENAKGLAISQANFCTIIDGCYESGSSHENDIMNGFRNSDFCRTANYVGFLKILAESFRYAEAGLLEDCLCETWTVERLGGDGNANMTVYTVDGGTATYDSLNDRYVGDANAGKIHLLVAMESALLPFTVDSVNCEFTLDNTGSPDTTNYIATTDGAGGIDTQIAVGLDFVDGAHTLGATDVGEVIGLAFRLEAQGTGGFVRLNKVSISGRGYNPFA